MEPLLIVLVPGLLGGLVLALLINIARVLNRQGPRTVVVPRHLAAPSPSLINMANIRVEGLGGLGMVAAVVAVAIADPRIRLATVIAGCLGTGLALVLIALRRRSGGMPWSGDGTDNRFTLRLDADERRRISQPGAAALDQGRHTTTGLRALPHLAAG